MAGIEGIASGPLERGPMWDLKTTLSAVFCILCVVITSTRLYTGYSNASNGPKPIPIIGNVGTLLRLKADLDGELLKLRERWGKICRLRIGNIPILIVNDPRAAKELLNEVRCDTPHLHLTEALMYWRSGAPYTPPDQNQTLSEKSFGLAGLS